MSKIQITADTESNDLQVIVNGQNIENVKYISIGLSPEYYDPGDLNLYVSINSFVEDEETGLKTHTTLIAKQSEEGKKILASGGKTSASFGDFVVVHKSNKVAQDIANFLIS